MITSIRFSDEELIAISAAADRKQTSRHEFIRQAILTAAGLATAKATPAAISTPATRKSTSINMSNLGDFYGQKH